MVEVLPGSRGSALLLRAIGMLSDADYRNVLIPRLEAIISEHGKARLLLDLSDFFGWEVAALWDDVRFGLAHKHDFERIAIVGGPRWMDWGVRLSALLMSGELRSFVPREREAAVAWIREGEAEE